MHPALAPRRHVAGAEAAPSLVKHFTRVDKTFIILSGPLRSVPVQSPSLCLRAGARGRGAGGARGEREHSSLLVFLILSLSLEICTKSSSIQKFGDILRPRLLYCVVPVAPTYTPHISLPWGRGRYHTCVRAHASSIMDTDETARSTRALTATSRRLVRSLGRRPSSSPSHGLSCRPTGRSFAACRLS